jgi:cytochrome bd ubiquinol oxidase subunit II
MILFWVGALAITILLYVLLDGFDLGVGILCFFARDELSRRQMLNAISPVWDGNETWLVLTAAILFGAFPEVYATLLSAFYLPMVLLLASLILRGVAFEFRYKTVKMRWLWDISFAGGSVIATFVQGLTVGALVEGIPMANGKFSGGPLSWLDPFSCLCGVGLCLGYSLLGSTWLVGKADGTLRDRAYTHTKFTLAGVFIFLVAIFSWSAIDNLEILRLWAERPYLLAFPAIGLLSVLVLLKAIRKRRDSRLFATSALIFLAAFGTLAVSFWPYMIPFSVTIDEAAAPPSSLAFMFWGEGIFVLPLTLVYTAVVYRTFRGKVVGGYDED